MPSAGQGSYRVAGHAAASLRRVSARCSGHHLHVREHRHEVRVAAPARDDVLVHVVEHPGACDAAEVPADVVPVRREHVPKRRHRGDREPVDLRRLVAVNAVKSPR